MVYAKPTEYKTVASVAAVSLISRVYTAFFAKLVFADIDPEI